MSLETIVPPDLLSTTCYRAFLNEYFHYKKQQRAGFSYRRFAALVGLKSPNYLQLVIQGKRNLTPDTSELIAKKLKLPAKEAHYFVALVRQDAAVSEKEKRNAERELYRAMKALRTAYLAKDRSQVFQKWYLLPIRELVFLQDFQATPEYVTQKLGGTLTLEQAEEALEFLFKHGFLKIQEGKVVADDPIIDSGDGLFLRRLIQEYHSQTLRVWSEMLSEDTQERQELGLITLPLPIEQIPVLRQKIRQFQDEVIGWAQQFQNPDILTQLGAYLFSFEIPNKDEKKFNVESVEKEKSV